MFRVPKQDKLFNSIQMYFHSESELVQTVEK